MDEVDRHRRFLFVTSILLSAAVYFGIGQTQFRAGYFFLDVKDPRWIYAALVLTWSWALYRFKTTPEQDKRQSRHKFYQLVSTKLRTDAHKECAIRLARVEIENQVAQQVGNAEQIIYTFDLSAYEVHPNNTRVSLNVAATVVTDRPRPNTRTNYTATHEAYLYQYQFGDSAIFAFAKAAFGNSYIADYKAPWLIGALPIGVAAYKSGIFC